MQCAKCSVSVKEDQRFALCDPCYDDWPKGKTLEEYFGRKLSLKITKLPVSELLRI